MYPCDPPHSFELAQTTVYRPCREPLTDYTINKLHTQAMSPGARRTPGACALCGLRSALDTYPVLGLCDRLEQNVGEATHLDSTVGVR